MLAKSMTLHFNRIAGLIQIGLLSFLVSCASTEPIGQPLTRTDIVDLNKPNENQAYRLAPGDRIAIKFYYNKELNEELIIRPDGSISLQLVGDVTATGQTPNELSATLTKLYAAKLGTGSENYRFGIGDRLSIKSFYHDKLNEEALVRPDGKISLQLIGDVAAAGLTPDQLRDILVEKFSRYLDAPDISVIVREFRRPDLTVIVRESMEQRIFVGGEVKQAGVQPLHGRLGLLGATMQAGGTLDSARLNNIVLLRRTKDNEAKMYSVNLRQILSGDTPDIQLKPFDVVYVPKSASSEAATALRQTIYNLLPNQFIFSLGYAINPQVEVK